MIDEKKVALMTQISSYEKKQENKELVISKYYKADYVRYNVLKQLVAITFVYWGVFAGYLFLKFEDMLVQINQIDYFSVMYKLLGGYVAFAFIYFVFSYLVYSYRYSHAKKGLTKYNGNLRKLIELEGGGRRKISAVVEDELDSILDDNDSISDYDEETEDVQKSINLNKSGANRGNVNRMAMVNQRMKESEDERRKQIIANAKRLNERDAAKKELEDERERQIEEDRKKIRERRMQLEREQMEKLRMEREQRMAQRRENYDYNNNEGGEE